MLKHDKQITLFLEQLHNYGVKDFVISPGSRSTPLVNNILNNKDKFNPTLILDERSAAYYALGISKKTKHPAVLICTSGTATLNYSPAIAEAYYSKIPLIIITADRPMYLRDTGSNQTLYQNNIYQNNINWFYDIPISEKESFISNIAFKALTHSISFPKGPVHINWQFEEPFTDGKLEKIQTRKFKEKIDEGLQTFSDTAQISSFIKKIKNKKGVILVGATDENTNEILRFSKILNWPIIADPLSNLRISKNYDENVIIDTGDIIYRTNNLKNIPEAVIHIGTLPVSKHIAKSFESAKTHVFLEKSARVSEGFFNISLHLRMGISNIIDEINKTMKNSEKINDSWKNYLETTNKNTRQKIKRITEEIEEFSCKKAILDSLPKSSTFISGNSLSIRILDIISEKNKAINFIGNRGLSGIDGNISIASGYSSVSENMIFLDLGDLAFFHDLGGLITAVKNSINLTIFVNNNQGGQIFNLLPQASHMREIYNDWFITPHSEFSIGSISESLGCSHFNPKNRMELKKIIKEKLDVKNINIIELDFSNFDYGKLNKLIENLKISE